MTALKATRSKLAFPKAGAGDACNVKIATGTYELAANPTAADTIDFCRLPAGAVVFGGWFMGDDIDTGTETLDIDIGWTDNGVEVADPDGLGNFGLLSGDAVTDVKPEVSLYYPLGGTLRTLGPRLFTAETLIQGVVNTAANAGGTGTLTVCVMYFMDPSYSVT